MPKDDLTYDYVASILSYDPDSGELRWKVGKGRRVRAGQIAGTLDDGYVMVRIDGRKYRAQRLAHLLMTGAWPEAPIVDHANRSRSDNRWENLREASFAQNAANSAERKNQTGYRGVKRHQRDGRFYASIRRGGISKHLGCFATAAEAGAAYRDAAGREFGEFSP